MRKKRFLSIMVIFSVICLFQVGGAVAKTQFLTIVTGGTAGTFYAVGTMFADTFNKTLKDSGYKWSAQSSGGSLENLEMIRTKETQLAFAGCAPTNFAYEGLQKFKGKAVKNIRYITAMWPEFVQIVVRKDAGINSWDDLKGKKVAVGPPAGGGTFYGPIILKALANLTFDDIKPEYLSYGDSAQALQNRLISAFYGAGGIPTSAVTQAFASRVDVDILDITQERFANLKKTAPFFFRGTIPKGTYPGQDADIKTAAMKCSFMARPEVSEDIVYKMLEALYDKELKTLQGQHHSLTFLSVPQAIIGLAGAPLHAGAVKFYKEHGLTVPENLIPPEMK